MKTIIRNGKTFRVSNKLYEEINRMGLLEANPVASNPMNADSSGQGNLFPVSQEEQIQQNKQNEKSNAIKQGIADKRKLEEYKQLVRPLVANMRVFASQFGIYNQKIQSPMDNNTQEKLITLFNGLIKSFNEDKEFIGMVIKNVLDNPNLKSPKAKREQIINYVIEQGDNQNFGKDELKAVKIVLEKDDFSSMKDAFKEIVNGDYNASENQLNYYRYNVIKGSVKFIRSIDPKLNMNMIDYPSQGWKYRLAPLKSILSILKHYQLTNEEVEIIKKKMPELSNYEFNSKDVISQEEEKNNKENLTYAFRILLYFDNGVKKFLIDNREAIVDSLLKKKIDPNGRDWMRIYRKLWEIMMPKISDSFVEKLQAKDLSTVNLPYDTDNPVKGFTDSDRTASKVWGTMNDPNKNLW